MFIPWKLEEVSLTRGLAKRACDDVALPLYLDFALCYILDAMNRCFAFAFWLDHEST